MLDRDGQQLSATETRQQALSDADHLAVLHAIWTAETALACQQRYRDLVAAALPPEHRHGTSHQARWLWRTLRGAELAGLDAGQVLAGAIAERDLAGAHDVPSVVDARIRYRLGSLVPVPAGPWSAQVPRIADPERRAYVTEIATLMDARKDRIGEHIAEHGLPWAVAALGPVPEHPLDRLDWQKKAASIGAFRELSGYDHPADPIGPEPAAAAPDVRAAWYEALAALGPAAGRTPAVCPTAGCCTCATPTLSKPPGHRNTWVTSCARSAPPPGTLTWPPCAPGRKRKPLQPRPARHRRPAAGTRRQLPHAARDLPATRDRVRRRHGRPRQLGCRHPRPASPGRGRRRRTTPPGIPAAVHPAPFGRTALPHSGPARRGTLTPGQPIPETVQWIKDLAAEHHAFADNLAERQSLTVPSEDPGYGDLGQAFPPWPGPARGAILQPPKPEIRPSPRVLQRSVDRDADLGGRRLTVARGILDPGR